MLEVYWTNSVVIWFCVIIMKYCTVIMLQLIGLSWKYITDRLTYLHDRNLEGKLGSELVILTLVFFSDAQYKQITPLDSWSLAALAMFSKHKRLKLFKRTLKQHNNMYPTIIPPGTACVLLCMVLNFHPTSVSQSYKGNLDLCFLICCSDQRDDLVYISYTCICILMYWF